MATLTIALISGANQGIGFEIAKKLTTEQQNWHILIGSRDLAKGDDAACLLKGLPSTVSAIHLDVSSDDSIADCVAAIERCYGYLNVLINNAGIASHGIASEPTLRKRYAKCLDTNVYGAAVLTEACVPLLKKGASDPQCPPRIVFVSSEMGSLTNTLDPNFPYYSLAHLVEYKTSKAAMNMVGATYAVKYDQEGWKVNMCCPGLRRTNLNKWIDAGGEPAQGAVNAVRLAILGRDGENGTFSNAEGSMDW